MNEILKSIPNLYQVGGCVRDELLGKVPKDYDYTTSLLPDEIEKVIRSFGKRVFVTGKRFGTIGFLWEKKMIEITTFRYEQYKQGDRKPTVTFGKTIDQDLYRRDFTINAIAKKGSRIIDPAGGVKDLEKRILRAVGNPSERFNEDPLRLLRLVRFVSQLGFSIEEKTLTSARKKAHLILSVSRERWMQEIEKLLLGEFVTEGLAALHETDLLKFVFPELELQIGYDQRSPYHSKNLWEHTVSVVSLSPLDVDVRLGALFHDVGKPFCRTLKQSGQANYIFHEEVGAEIIYGIAKRLKWSEERRKIVTDIVRNHAMDTSPIRAADISSH